MVQADLGMSWNRYRCGENGEHNPTSSLAHPVSLRPH